MKLSILLANFPRLLSDVTLGHLKIIQTTFYLSGAQLHITQFLARPNGVDRSFSLLCRQCLLGQQDPAVSEPERGDFFVPLSSNTIGVSSLQIV